MERKESVPYFCPHCGKVVSPDEEYCPDCGQIVIDIPAEERKRLNACRKSMIRLNWSVVLLGAFSVLSVVGAIISFVTSDVSGNILSSTLGSELASTLNSMELTQEQYNDILDTDISASLLAGVFAVMSMICCFRRRCFTLALGACIASSVILLVEMLFMNEKMIMSMLTATVIQSAVGIFVATMIYMSRDQFKSIRAGAAAT